MERKGESKLGIASLIFSIISTFIFISKFIFIFFFLRDDPEFYVENGLIILIFVYTFFIIVFSFIALSLGIAGIFQKTRVRKFAITGTTISSAILTVYSIRFITSIFSFLVDS